MRKLLFGLLAAFFLMGSSAGVIAAQDDATPAAEAGGETNPTNPQIGDTVTYFASNGDPQVMLTVADAFRDWEDYDEFSEPDRGVTYLAVELEVENVSDEAFELDPYRFGLQDGQGFYFGTSWVTPAEGAEPEVLTEAVEVDGGDSWTGLVVFEVYDEQPLGSLYWNESGILLTLADLSEV
jgi:hypothetical protein